MNKYFKNVVTLVTCSCLFFAFTGCKDDEEPALQPEDDDLVETKMIPEDDTEKPFMTGVLYYFNEIQEAKDDNTLEDNLARRFSSKKKWNGETLQKGDCLLANDEDVPNSFQDLVRKEALIASFKNGALLMIDGGNVAHYEALCQTVKSFNFFKVDVPDETPKAKETTGRSLWMLSGNLPGCQILATVLETTDKDGKSINDYAQGEKVSLVLHTYLRDCTPPASLSKALRSGESDLMMIANAYKVLHTHSMTLYGDDDFFEEKKSGYSRSSSFQYEYSIYPMYSANDNRYYYYIHNEMIVPFEPYYLGVFNTKDAGIPVKACEYYGSQVTATFLPYVNGVNIHQTEPATTQGAVSYTSGVSYSLSGTVGYSSKAGATASVTGGMSVSNSQSYTVQDITVSNLCKVGSSPELKWDFNFRGAGHAYKFTNTGQDRIIPPSLTGQTTFTGGSDFIMSAPTAGGSFQSTIDVTVRATAGILGIESVWKTRHSNNKCTLSLPKLIMPSEITQ